MKAPIVEAMMAPGTDRLADRVRKPVKVKISSEGMGGKIFSAAINKATAT